MNDAAGESSVSLTLTVASTTGGTSNTGVFRQVPAVGRFAIPIAGGAEADHIVIKNPGTHVHRGQILVEHWAETSAAPLAPANGRIAGLGVAKLSARRTVPAILFEPDVAAPPSEFAPPATTEAFPNMLRWLRELDLAGAIRHLRENGVWADRWTTPDLLGQLRDCIEKPVDTVICNVLDESPDLLLHHELAMAFPVDLVAGVLALAQMTNAEDVFAVVAAFGNSVAWDLLREAVADTKIKLVPLQDHYPQAHPTLLIHEITSRHARPVCLPSKAGVLTVDAAAAIAVGRCFLYHEPMISVPVGFREQLTRQRHWLHVPVGMPWSQVLSHLSIYKSSTDLRAGNPLRELRLSSDCVASGTELSVTATPPERRMNPDPCIRCAWCVEGCPVRIQPAGLLEAAQQEDPYLADQYGLDACIECGICSYVCPSHLPILAGIRKLRA